MQVETSKANKLQLDYGLAKAMGADSVGFCEVTKTVDVKFGITDWPHAFNHLDPEVWGSLAEKHKIDMQWGTSGKVFVVMSGDDSFKWHGGKTIAEAVARCVIENELGSKFECPDELGEQHV